MQNCPKGITFITVCLDLRHTEDYSETEGKSSAFQAAEKWLQTPQAVGIAVMKIKPIRAIKHYQQNYIKCKII